MTELEIEKKGKPRAEAKGQQRLECDFVVFELSRKQSGHPLLLLVSRCFFLRLTASKNTDTNTV